MLCHKEDALAEGAKRSRTIVITTDPGVALDIGRDHAEVSQRSFKIVLSLSRRSAEHHEAGEAVGARRPMTLQSVWIV